MDAHRLHDLWAGYRSRAIDEVVHQEDHMFNTARQPADYFYVGESAATVLLASLMVAPTQWVNSVLDFGCGHGRVARHLRALFPDAELTFADADTDGARFCAERYGGRTAETSDSFGALALPGTFDLIWVGSVFTHIDWVRMRQLYTALVDSLAPNGALVATFHGEEVVARGDGQIALGPAKWNSLVDEYRKTGVAWQPYNGALGETGWGVSLIAPLRAFELAEAQPVSFVGYMAKAWANYHDIGVWARR